MKRRTVAVTVTILTTLVVMFTYYICGMMLFTNEVKAAFPELKEQSTTLFVPWPLGPKWISHVPPNHELYQQGDGNCGGSFQRDGCRVVVMASDGTVIATRE